MLKNALRIDGVDGDDGVVQQTDAAIELEHHA